MIDVNTKLYKTGKSKLQRVWVASRKDYLGESHSQKNFSKIVNLRLMILSKINIRNFLKITFGLQNIESLDSQTK